MIHTEIEFDGAVGKVKVRIEPGSEESTSVMVTTKDGVVVLDADELEHIHRLLQAHRAAQEAAIKALEV